MPLLLLHVLHNNTLQQQSWRQDARLASLPPLFVFAIMACCLPLFGLAYGLLMPSESYERVRRLCGNGKVRTRHLSCFFCSLLTLDTCIAGKMCDALDQTEDAQTTSILTVLRDLRFAGKRSSSYVSLVIHLHSPLIPEVRFFCSFH